MKIHVTLSDMHAIVIRPLYSVRNIKREVENGLGHDTKYDWFVAHLDARNVVIKLHNDFINKL